jgi:hypothetical protein
MAGRPHTHSLHLCGDGKMQGGQSDGRMYCGLGRVDGYLAAPTTPTSTAPSFERVSRVALGGEGRHDTFRVRSLSLAKRIGQGVRGERFGRAPHRVTLRPAQRPRHPLRLGHDLRRFGHGITLADTGLTPSQPLECRVRIERLARDTGLVPFGEKRDMQWRQRPAGTMLLPIAREETAQRSTQLLPVAIRVRPSHQTLGESVRRYGRDVLGHRWIIAYRVSRVKCLVMLPVVTRYVYSRGNIACRDNSIARLLWTDGYVDPPPGVPHVCRCAGDAQFRLDPTRGSEIQTTYGATTTKEAVCHQSPV